MIPDKKPTIISEEIRPIRHAIIPAAGLGTRMKTITGNTSKEMINVANRPAIDWVIQEARSSGCEQIAVILRKGKEDLITHITNSWPQVKILWQEVPLGLGDAILSARNFVSSHPFAILLPDDLHLGHPPALKQLVDIFSTARKSVLALIGPQNSRLSMFSDYGRPPFQPDTAHPRWFHPRFNKEGWGERAVFGRYILSADIMGVLETTKKNTIREYSEGKALEYLADKKQLIGYQLTGQCLTVGVPAGLEFAHEFSQKLNIISSLDQEYIS
jgi:UTP--glucose-1-phosphate uridylyltransferase